jgi:hypothetical protein
LGAGTWSGGAGIVDASLHAIRRLHETVKAHPDQARDVVVALFDKIVFTPVSTPNGPRYELEGVAEIGRLLTLDSDAKWASAEGVAQCWTESSESRTDRRAMPGLGASSLGKWRPYVDEFRTALLDLAA